MSATSLKDRVVILTGASRGVGKALALELASRGASLFITSRDAEKLAATRALVEAEGGRVGSVAVDIRDADAASRIVGGAVEAFGGVDAIVNNAQAAGGAAPFMQHTEEHFDLALDTGPRAIFRLMKAVYPHLKARGGGSIVNFASRAGTTGGPMWATYAAAKEATRGFSKVAAAEWAADNIRVNVVCPFVRTEGFETLEKADPAFAAQLVKAIPLRRLGDPRKDVGGLVAFLISDDGAYMTGQTLFADGGGGSVK
jgi:NAD(P)-dependent dehydrogenase (short-subunit alcohol dehydrogenase family)